MEGGECAHADRLCRGVSSLRHFGFGPSFLGSISAILRMQSAAVLCGPDTNVPLTLITYQPDSTPRRRASSALTCLGERFCMTCCRLAVRADIDPEVKFSGRASHLAFLAKPS